MATTPYNLRRRLNGNTPTLRSTPTASPSNLRSGTRSPRKTQPPISLQLQHVIGATTTSPPGLASCALNNTYAYCAGSVAVLAEIQADGETTKRYYRARPTTTSINPGVSHYNGLTSTSTRRRTSLYSSNQPREVDKSIGSIRDQGDGSLQTWTARERIKTISCVALSNDGRWLAVGESGYSPRVLLYSREVDASRDIPTSIVSDHTIGVRCIAFSPDGRYLATLGNLNDGFLFIWTINQRTGQLSLHAANKCTTNICDMTWCGQALITAGTRHVKAWNVSESSVSTPTKRPHLRASIGKDALQPGVQTLIGHNALLVSLVDCTFTAIATVDTRTVLLATDAGHLCLFEPDRSSDVQVLKVYDCGISTIAWQPSTHRIVLGGRYGLMYEDIEPLLAALRANDGTIMNTRATKKKVRSSAVRMSLSLHYGNSIGIAAVTCLPKHTVCLDTDGNLQTETTDEESSRPTVTFASHNDLILGVRRLPGGHRLGSFYTWSRRGDIKFWNTGGDMTHSIRADPDQVDDAMEHDLNELRIARLVPSSDQFILGDRIGVLQLYDFTTGMTRWVGRAHSAEVNDLDIHEGTSLVASCSRDRTVQLFSLTPHGLQLMQTMDDHIGAVSRVAFSKDGARLLSCSVDRTIIVRECAKKSAHDGEASAYLSMRVVTLKSAPLSMAFTGRDSLLISTNDRHLATVDLVSGMIVETTKLTDPENDDTVSLGTIHFSARGEAVDETMDIVLACSPTDKSIRIYDGKRYELITKESGHTEGVSDLCLIEDSDPDSGTITRRLVSTGLDGTIMIWNVARNSSLLPSSASDRMQTQIVEPCDGDGTPSKARPSMMAPLRKILSKVEVLEFAQASGQSSPSSPRSLSPPRLARKHSHLNVTCITEEPINNALDNTSDRDNARNAADAMTCPGSPDSPMSSSTPQKTRSALGGTRNAEESKQRRARSPSPQRTGAVSTPTTPHRGQAQANNARLRRPPSIPNDLRERALTQRRRSMSQANEFGGIGMAAEQATRMLKAFRKKLASSKDEVDLDDLEVELEEVAKLVRERKAGPRQTKSLNGTLRRPKGQPLGQPTESEMGDLAVLLERTNLAQRSPKIKQEHESMKT
ncbi:WD repeat-containing protein 62 [Cyphellophora attinorum]|uniref:WD repeat-containing protein 62 n=1 Tax=Cyphellophora attinorum TaxID=1664694 RepID=A0A0N0NL34_9EURO|nr:WD repeat-containing protein 62 [Phialophora attinorum]KPI38569.1 WD repeat-containing protein 62 [Phialophora attinorum]